MFLIEKILLPAFYLLYIYLIYIIPLRRFEKEYGFTPKAYTNSTEVDKYLQYSLFFSMVTIGFFFFINLWSILEIKDLLHFIYLEELFFDILGCLFLSLSIAFSMLGQRDMKKSWRIGIDTSASKINLVTTGIYKKTRNPIALGFIFAFIGVFIIIPNVGTLFTCIISIHVIILRVLLEEEQLLSIVSDEYQIYCKKVPRWLSFRNKNSGEQM